MSLASRTPPTAEEYASFKERFSNWGRWGADDQLGTLNFITPDVRRAAAGLVREGRSVSCARPLATERVASGPRNPQPADHKMNILGAMGCSDYVGVSYHGFINTHIDGLCHIFTPDGQLYNGRPKSAITAEGARTNSVDFWRDGIVTRGVLYDVVRHRAVDYVPFEAPVHGWELEDIAKAEGVSPRAGDAVLIRAGCDAFWAANPDFAEPWAGPGIHASVLEFLHAHDASLLGWDLMEAAGQGEYGAPALPIHSIAIPYMGMPLVDNASFESLAPMCAELGRWEFQFVIAPLYVVGGTGSPANPIAVF
jgi:kynurenine formamidase